MVTVFVGVPSITTLGMIFLLNGLTLIMSGAFPWRLPGNTFFEFFGGGAYVTVYWALGVIVAILLNRTRWGSARRHRWQPHPGARRAATSRSQGGNFVLCSTLAAWPAFSESVRLTSIRRCRVAHRSCSTRSPRP